MTSYRHSQAQRPAPWWVALIGLVAYAAVAAGAVYLGWVVLMSLAQYVPSSLR